MPNKKLPRRTMSMAKRATKTAEKAADLDLLEEVIGDTTAPVGFGQLLLGWAMAVATILIVIVAVKVLFGGGVDTNLSMLPEGYRESTGLPVANDHEGHEHGAQGAGDAEPTTSGGHSGPFPIPRTSEPVIVTVDCPAGTVQISTGPRPADTVCVQGQLAESPVEPTSQAQPIIIVAPNGDTSTVGGTDVPDGLHCTEDEGIAFDGRQVDTLVCVATDDTPTPTPVP